MPIAAETVDFRGLKKKVRKKKPFYKRGLLGEVIRYPIAYSMMLPCILYTVLFGYATYPFMITAFQNYKPSMGIAQSAFIGLDNFKIIFANSSIWRIIWNTIFLNTLSITSVTVIGLLLALLFNELNTRFFSKISVSVLLFPKFLSWTVVAYILYALLGTTSGLFNSILKSLGQEAVNWYSSPQYWPLILTVTKTWKAMGMKTVTLTAALAGIDPSIYEAAKIDGASRFQYVKRITIPMVMPIVCMMLLMDVGHIFNGDFGMIYALIGDNGILYSTNIGVQGVQTR